MHLRLVRAGLCAALLGLSLALALASAAARPGDSATDLIARADRLFDEKSYEEARRLYREAVDAAASPSQVTRAAQRVIVCLIRLARFDEALDEAEAGVARAKGPALEARARRLAGNLYLSVPHWGTRSGGKYRRNVWEQGIQVESTRHDKRLAVAHLEKAREAYARADGSDGALAALSPEERARWHEERIECLLDLAGATARFGPYEGDASYWWGAEMDEEAATTAGEDDFQEYASRWQSERKRPIGLPLGPDGAPAFAKAPASYALARGDDERILALLDEVRALDATKDRRHAALATYRQAMLARARFGMDRLSGYATAWWSDGGYPLQSELEAQKPWELGPGEALLLAGGKIVRAKLPPQWDVLALLRSIEREHDEAAYAVGLYLQSRRQLTEAIAQYEALLARRPAGEWAASATQQLERIRRPEAALSQTGLQLPGAPARLEVQHRNVDRIWLTARAIDLEGFLRSIHDQPFDPDKGIPSFWALSQWAQYFVYDYEGDPTRALAAARVGKEIARWSVPVERDPAMRYAKATVRAPLEGAGAYLVVAYASEPPQADAAKDGAEALTVGASRAVVALTDLAFVEKKAAEGNLYYVCDAAKGAPVAGAKLRLLEQWTTYDQGAQKSVYHEAVHDLVTDAQGLALLRRPGRELGQLHMIATAAGADGPRRLAWSGMDYWGWYSPSQMRQGTLAYCITDRPVYRPAQTVQVKVWLREVAEGNLTNVPSREVSLEVYDPRGDKVHAASGRTDPMGGFETRLTLGDEPPLGQYAIYVSGASDQGGNVFRVEEYRKPEMDVTVEPAKTHARLGERIGATVRARYSFGAPVSQATVKYRVLREEYTHAYFFPGEWDWLYGPGYGWSWYAYDWFPWWGRWRCCWCPPAWWWGGTGAPAPTPVRELVLEGEAPIGKDGTLALEIDTAAAKRDHGDRDHRYVVQAEVRDASRRVVTGEGAVTATRQSFAAYVQPDKGWYAPGEAMTVRLRCLGPDDGPVEAEGVLTVSEVVYGGADNGRIEETERERMTVKTDARGEAEVKLHAGKSGQWKLRFETPDAWGGKVDGFALAWVVGQDFDGRLYRFNDLELVTDKRTYRPGETAHVLLSTKIAGSHVLWSDQVDNEALLSWRLLALEGKSAVVDVPITDERRPNFFVEATTVAGMRVHQQSRQICVPPEEGVMSVTVTTDKQEYRPGETMRVTVTAVDRSGKPARAQVVLSAFDRSVLYIQPELTPPIAGFFHGRLRSHEPQMTTNVQEQLAAWASLASPAEALYPPPPAWYGVWGPAIGDYRVLDDSSLEAMSGFAKERAEKSSFGYQPAGAKGGAGVAGAALAGNVEDMERQGVPVGQPAMRRGREGRDHLERDDDGKKAPEPTGDAALVEAQVRKLFADTAAFLPSLATDERGRAEASVTLPENLTTWKLSAWGMTEGTRVGQASTQAVTTKNLLVRLEAPRFFTERDEVVVSASVHNYLRAAKRARVSLAIPEGLLALAPRSAATVDIDVPSSGEARVDWRLRALREGDAALTVKALTDEESDAMQLRVPVLVHGVVKQVSQTVSMRPEDTAKSLGIELVVPEARRPELTRLEVAYSPSLIGAMLDAVPYCLRYPYGCTEQTVSRFLPAVLTKRTLRALGMKLEDVREVRGRMAEIRRMEKDRHVSVYADSPVFDDEELDRIIAASLSRIANMQQGDGGWGWWATDRSDPYLTSYVLFALASARDADVAVNEALIQRGAGWLKAWEENEMRRKDWSVHAQHAFVAYALSLARQRAAIEPAADDEDERPKDLLDRLFAGRDRLTLYGKALLSLALANADDGARARTVLENILQYKVVTEETEVARFRVPEEGWWWWWNGEIETNAWCLRALVRLDPRSDLAPKVAKWLLDNRRNGTYWRSTLDTTLCVAAIGELVQASGEGDSDYTVRLDLDDGAVVKEVKIDRKSFFSFDGVFALEGAALKGGTHKLEITKTGKGALYVSSRLSYFTMEEGITASGHELHVKRSYYRLAEVTHTASVEGAAGRSLDERRLRYERIPLAEGDAIASGDLVQVELLVSGDDDYAFLALEDRKAAGLEPVDVRSGDEGQEGFLSYRELRDEKVVFFMGALERGDHLLRYRLRAEAPGVFHALPPVIYAMYAPELRASGDESVIRIKD